MCDIYDDSNLTDEILYVITTISNPICFQKRYALFDEFCKRMKKVEKIELISVELQQGHRPFVTDATIKLRTKDIIWYKENLINIAASKLPKNWKYLLTIDSDVKFLNNNWREDILNALQIYDVIQPFSHVNDLGPNGETLQIHTGLFYAYCNGENINWSPTYKNQYHTGYGLAFTRQAFDAISMLEIGILGSADRHMTFGLLGLIDQTLNSKLNPNYKKLCHIYQERALKHIKRNVGYITGSLFHFYHGCKSSRHYDTRWNILIDNKFDPTTDLYKDSQGLIHLDDDKIKLRDDIRHYFRARNEDSNNLNIDYKYTKKSWC